MKFITNGVKCPECDSQIHLFGSSWNSGDIYYFCSNCGYKFVTTWCDYEFKDIIVKDCKVDYTYQNIIPDISENQNIVGCYIIGNEIGGPISGPIHKNELDVFREEINEIRPKTKITQVTVIYAVDGKLVAEKI